MISHELNKIHYSPLWRKNPFQLLYEIINAGFKAIIISVPAEGLDENFLGKEIDFEMISKLKKIK
jgi:diphthamide synthase (EF-2-diphthine--ammonia ligase)